MKVILLIAFLAIAAAKNVDLKVHNKRQLDLNPYNSYSQQSILPSYYVQNEEVSQHTVHNIINKVPVAIPQPYAVPVTKYQGVLQPYPVHVEKPVPVGVKINVPVPVEKPYLVKVPQQVPYEVKVKVPYAVEKPYPVTITKTIPVTVEKPVYVKVPEIVKVPVAQPYPVPIERKVSVTVPEPILVKVPEYYNFEHKQPMQQYYQRELSLPVYYSHLLSPQFAQKSMADCPFTHKHQGSTIRTIKLMPTYGYYDGHNIFPRSTTENKVKKN